MPINDLLSLMQGCLLYGHHIAALESRWKAEQLMRYWWAAKIDFVCSITPAAKEIFPIHAQFTFRSMVNIQWVKLTMQNCLAKNGLDWAKLIERYDWLRFAVIKGTSEDLAFTVLMPYWGLRDWRDLMIIIRNLLQYRQFLNWSDLVFCAACLQQVSFHEF